MTADFLVELLQAMRQWSITFKVLKKEKEKKNLNLEFFTQQKHLLE